MGIVRFEHGLSAARAPTRHDFRSLAPRRNTAMRYAHDSTSGFPRWEVNHDEIARIGVIRAMFESAQHVWLSNPNLLLPARSHHVAAQQADRPPKHEKE
jgi:hypothetical protein